MTHYVGLWWDSPPLDLQLGEPQDATETISSRHWDNDDYEDTEFDVVEDEPRPDAIQHLIDAGVSSDEANEIISGYNSIHIISASPWVHFGANVDDDKYRNGSRLDLKVGSFVDSQDNVIGPIWTRIQESPFWDAYFEAYTGDHNQGHLL